MTPLITAAEALLAGPFVAGCVFLIVCAVVYVARRERLGLDTSPLDDRDEYARRCGTSLDDLICDRVSGHDGVHTDSRHGRELGWARWTQDGAA